MPDQVRGTISARVRALLAARQAVRMTGDFVPDGATLVTALPHVGQTVTHMRAHQPSRPPHRPGAHCPAGTCDATDVVLAKHHSVIAGSTERPCACDRERARGRSRRGHGVDAARARSSSTRGRCAAGHDPRRRVRAGRRRVHGGSAGARRAHVDAARGPSNWRPCTSGAGLRLGGARRLARHPAAIGAHATRGCLARASLGNLTPDPRRG